MPLIMPTKTWALCTTSSAATPPILLYRGYHKNSPIPLLTSTNEEAGVECAKYNMGRKPGMKLSIMDPSKADILEPEDRWTADGLKDILENTHVGAAQALADNSGLPNYLNFRNCAFDDTVTSHLAAIVGKYAAPVALCLTNNGLTDDALPPLLLDKSYSALFLSDNYFALPSATVLRNHLTPTSHLHTLSLNKNKLSQTFLTTLVDYLPHGNLRVIGLTECGLKSEPVKVLFKALVAMEAKGKGLARLFLNCNEIDDDCGEDIVEFLENSTHLRRLGLASNRFGDRTGDRLTSAVPLCEGLERICLAGNEWSNAVRGTLARIGVVNMQRIQGFGKDVKRGSKRKR